MKNQNFYMNKSNISLVPGGGRLPLNAIALALGIWVFSGSSAMAYGGSRARICDWGEYGLGPHLAYHGCGYGDLGYPYFTHGMGYGSPYYGYSSGDTNYGGYGPFTGAPPDRDTIAPHYNRLNVHSNQLDRAR